MRHGYVICNFMFPPPGIQMWFRVGNHRGCDQTTLGFAIGKCPNKKWVGHPELGDQLTLIMLLFFFVECWSNYTVIL